MAVSSGRRGSNVSLKIGIAFSKIGLSPNQWTLLALVPTLIALYFLIKENFLLAAIFFLISAFLEVVDGSVARVMGKVTKLGAYLDTIVDRYVEGIILFGLLFASLPSFTIPILPGFVIPVYAWVFLFFFGGMLTAYAKAAAKEKNLVLEEIKGGLLERSERLIILFLGILLAIADPLYLTYVIALLAVFTNISALQRIWKATHT